MRPPPKPRAAVGSYRLVCHRCGAQTDSDNLSDTCPFCGAPIVAVSAAALLGSAALHALHAQEAPNAPKRDTTTAKQLGTVTVTAERGEEVTVKTVQRLTLPAIATVIVSGSDIHELESRRAE